jgi:peptide/nickel transport system ATP-binding protein
LHPYTEALLSAVPIADPTVTLNRIPLEGEIPNPANAPSGCFFHTRCRYCADVCSVSEVSLAEKDAGRFVACHKSDYLSLQGINIMPSS